MEKVFIEFYAQIMAKYGVALAQLHPSQTEALKDALLYWMKYEKVPQTQDSFTQLALLMIVSDLLYQERTERGKCSDCRVVEEGD